MDETVIRAQIGGREYDAPSGVVHVIVGSSFDADALSARWAHLRYERKKRAGGSAWQMVKFLRDAS